MSKKTQVLKDRWQLIQLPNPVERLKTAQLAGLQSQESDVIAILEMPAQVHDVLLQNSLISEEVMVGWCKSVIWVGKNDWVYRCSFDVDMTGQRAFLRFQGLDTLADIYLNGKLIARHDDFFLPERVEITEIGRASCRVRV